MAEDARKPPTKAGACPICGKPRDPAFRPFCSRRCADVDLGRWLKEGYAIPAVEPPDGFEDGGFEDGGVGGRDAPDDEPRR